MRRQAQRSSILWFPAAKHGMLPSAFSFKGKDPVCVGHCRVHSWDFKGQQISAGGFTSDRGREKETKEITSAWECVYGLLVILTLHSFSALCLCAPIVLTTFSLMSLTREHFLDILRIISSFLQDFVMCACITVTAMTHGENKVIASANSSVD